MFDETGGEYFITEETEELALKRYNEIREIMNRPPAYTELRRAEYPPLSELIVALWEKVIEGRDDKAINLQVRRIEVKQKYPKK